MITAEQIRTSIRENEQEIVQQHVDNIERLVIKEAALGSTYVKYNVDLTWRIEQLLSAKLSEYGYSLGSIRPKGYYISWSLF